MTQCFHFISGLPRSGSTLLGALLRQNPRFYASMSSPLGGLVELNLQHMSAGSEIALLVNEEQRRDILKGLFASFYGPMTDKQVVFDTNRTWCARLPTLLTLFPSAKIICTVRNVAWVMDSLELLIRANPFENTRLFSNPSERGTVYSRVDTLANRDRLVGFAWSALKEAFYSEHAQNLLVIEYELLAQAPENVLRLVYDFIGEPYHAGHDVENVTFDAPEFDAALGVRGLHRVHQKVAWRPRRTILPPDLFARYDSLAFWRDRTGSKANVIVVKEEQAGSDTRQELAPRPAAPDNIRS